MLAAASAALLFCAAAQANPLLSGYGGPGQGNQVLLGSTLLNGPKGGGSSGPRGGQTAPAHTIEAPAVSTSGAAKPARSGKSRSHGTLPQTSARAAEGRTPLSAPLRSASTDPLGLSTTDVVLIVVALCTLLATGLLLGRFSRASHGGRTGG